MDLVAEMAVLNPFDFFLESYAQKFPFRYEPAEERELAPFRTTGPATPLLTRYLAGIAREPQATVDFLVELNRRLAAEVKYVIRMEPGVQSPEETLEKRSGRAAIRPNSWCRSCAIWGSPRDSFPAT